MPARVVEMVPALVVEIVPVLVVEIVPLFASAGPEIVRTKVVTQIMDLSFVIVLLLVDSNVRGDMVGLRICPAKPFLWPT